MLKVAMTSLGCAKNLVDSEVMMGILKANGCDMVLTPEEADILIVNTCGFIESAKEESVNAILDAAGYKEGQNKKKLIVTGCLAERYKDDLLEEIPEIDGLIGVGDITRIASVVEEAIKGLRPAYVENKEFVYDHEMPRVLSTPQYSAYLKIAEGCDNCCSYCAIPLIRGRFRSRPIESIVNEAQALANNGVRELNVIAQDTTKYGLDLYGDFKLAELLKKVSQIEGIQWIRILYAYPTEFTEELIEEIASNDKICKYIDIPLQHADDEILHSMNRKGTQQDILQLIENLRKRIPGIALRTSFIVGFPGETEEKFTTLLDFVKKVKFDKLGVFTYSPEEGTAAFNMNFMVDHATKEQRRDLLMKVQQNISLEINQNKIGETAWVLIEGQQDDSNGQYVGRTEKDAPEVDGKILIKGKELNKGEIVRVKVTHAYEYDLIGEVLDESKLTK